MKTNQLPSATEAILDEFQIFGGWPKSFETRGPRLSSIRLIMWTFMRAHKIEGKFQFGGFSENERIIIRSRKDFK
jgi:hypothetical protein